jgi:hypothetical protein
MALPTIKDMMFQLNEAQSRGLIKGYSFGHDGCLYIEYKDTTKASTKFALQDHIEATYKKTTYHPADYGVLRVDLSSKILPNI